MPERFVNARFGPVELERLEALAAARGQSRSAVLRALVMAADVDVPEAEIPSEAEILTLLAGRARAGNVSALRALQVWHERQRRAKDDAEPERDRMADLEPPTPPTPLRVVS